MSENRSRREYLLAAAGILPFSGCGFISDGSTGGRTTSVQRKAAKRRHHEIQFDTVVNAIDDLGMDPDGNEPIDTALTDALETGTLIEFPPGDYFVTEKIVIEGFDRIGLRGTGNSRRDVRLFPPQGSHVRMLGAGQNGVGAAMLENLSFDELNDDSSQISLELWTTGGLVVRNVEFLGRTPDDNGPRSSYTMATDVLTQDGVALYDTVVAGLDQPAVTVGYPDGVSFLRAGTSHKGEVLLRNPIIHERNSSATRYNAGSGVVTIEGGEFINNQNAPIRFGAGRHPTKVSRATGSYVQVDDRITDTGEAVRIGGSDNSIETGAVCQDLTIDWFNRDARGVFSLVDFSPHGRAEFKDCVIRNNGSNAPNVFAAPVSTDDDAIIVENCTFTGTGDGDFIARGRSDSVIRNCCINMPNVDIQGFRTANIRSSDCR